MKNIEKKKKKTRKLKAFKVRSIGPFILSLMIVIAVVIAAFVAVLFAKVNIPLIDDRITFCVAIGFLLVIILAFVLTSLSDRKRSVADGEALEEIIAEAEKVLREAEDEERKEAEAAEVRLTVGDGSDTVERFSRLSAIDRAEIKEPEYKDDVDLKRLCEDFRNYAASKKGLYYDIKTVRSFVSGLAVSRLVIFQGMSGTGKTSLACAFGDFLKNPSVLIPVQPSWKEKTDLVGYFNEFTKNYNETELLAKIYEAGGNGKMYITVLDEMNIARVEYYFAEFLSVLEMPDPERRLIEIVSDSVPGDPERIIDGKVKLPENMWYIGTANNDDSTMAISDKVYDRAMIIDLDRRALPFDAPEVEAYPVSYEKFASLIKQAKRRYGLTLRNRRRIEQLDSYLIENLGITFGNRIMRQIEGYVPVYVACGGSELEAIDTVLAKKVLRKLESKNPVYVRNAAAALSLYLDELFGEESMPICRAMLSGFDALT